MQHAEEPDNNDDVSRKFLKPVIKKNNRTVSPPPTSTWSRPTFPRKVSKQRSMGTKLGGGCDCCAGDHDHGCVDVQEQELQPIGTILSADPVQTKQPEDMNKDELGCMMNLFMDESDLNQLDEQKWIKVESLLDSCAAESVAPERALHRGS